MSDMCQPGCIFANSDTHPDDCITLPPANTPPVRDALIHHIRAVELADWNLQTDQLADAILERFDVRLKP